MQTDSGTAVLFVFAHQDDEVAAASRIEYESARGATVFCAFLTNGGLATPAGARDAESRAMLTDRGVAAERIAFIGSDHGIPGGRLVQHLDRALEHLQARMAGVAVGSVYCLAWEGGNQDHDSSHLVAAAFAQRRGILDRCFEMPLYRAGAGPLFRVLSPLPGGGPWEERPLTLRQGIELSLLAWRYPSQRRTWLGLFPELFAQLAVCRRERIRPVDRRRLWQRPHEGRLLYERRRRFSYEHFAGIAAPFLAAHFSAEPGGQDGSHET